MLCLGHGSGGRPVFWPEIGDGADSDGRAEAVPANSARRDLPGRSEPFCPFRRVLRSALVPRGPLQPVFLLSSSGLQRLSEEAGPVAFPRMPCFRPVSEPEAAGMSSCAHVCRSVCSRRSGLLPGRDSGTVARRFFCFDNFDLFCTDLAVFWDPARGIQFAIP